jgi:glutaredoxin 3
MEKSSANCYDSLTEVIMVRADRIVVYKTERCGYCSAAIRFLTDNKGAEIEIVDLTLDPAARQELMAQTGKRTVPQIFIGEVHVGGFDELRALDRAGGLDPLLSAVAAARK